MCSQNVRYIEVQLIKNVFMQHNNGAVRLKKKRMSRVRVKGVRSRHYEKQNVQVMALAEESTAIGTIVANYYTVEAKAVMQGQTCSCCSYVHPKVSE